MLEKFRNRLANAIKAKNSMSLPQEFMRYGNRSKELYPQWSNVEITDREQYKGYGYAAIRNRANATARLAIENIHTSSDNEDFDHPYLPLIQSSDQFTAYQFWYNASTYLDLEGVFYLYVLRSFAEDGRVGTAQYFKLLNPYNIRRILDAEHLTVSGYMEVRGGMERLIAPEQIIEIKELNPFNEFENYAIADAAKGPQFTLRTAGDYTRNALNGNINTPGIYSTDIIMETQKFENLVARLKDHGKGEPLFANGAGALTYQDTSTDMSKSALPEINEINRDELLTTFGVSKTIMGIEQSGTTRDTAETQKELSVENQILPRCQIILDALNLDYRRSYPDSFKSDQAVLYVSNPNEDDYTADLAETQSRDAALNLFNKLVNAGYTSDLAGKYVDGEIDVEDLGDPTEEPKTLPTTPIPSETNPQTQMLDLLTKLERKFNAFQEKKAAQSVEHKVFVEVEKTEEKKSQPAQDLIKAQEGTLQNAITNIDHALVANAVAKVLKINNANDATVSFDQEGDILTKTQKNDAMSELKGVLTVFYGIMLTIQGPVRAQELNQKYNLPASFSLDKVSRSYIKSLSNKVAQSHIDTVTGDIYATARDAALKGMSQDQIVSQLTQNYSDVIVSTRAKTIARTETRRAFTRSQFDADRQFVDSNDLSGRAYKEWVTLSSNPCEFCQALADEPPIPFDLNFRDLGDTVTAGGNTLDVDFESLGAGDAHPNCSCEYELIIQ